MAAILIIKTDTLNPDPIKDARACYKRGDIFAIYPDNSCPEAPAIGSNLLLIKCPELTLSEAREQELDTAGITRRCSKSVDIASLSGAIRNNLTNNRQATISKDAFIAAVVVRDVTL
jgi:hypothetical protein